MTLWLRTLTMALLVLAAWNPSVPLQPVRTVVLLDQSPSAREAVTRFAPQVATPSAKYVAFASGAEPVAAATARRVDLGEGTNLAAALEAARQLEPDRIVLISDGLFQTTGVPSAPLFALYQPPSPNLSVSLVPPALPTRGETVEVRVVLESTAPATARLTLSGPAGTQTRSLSVRPGRSSVGYRFSLEQPSRVSVRVQSGLGTEEASVQINPVDTTRVWVLGDPSMARYLRAQGFAVTERRDVPNPVEAEVIVVGLGVRDLQLTDLATLQSFLGAGGSILWTATPRGLFFGGWERSTLAGALPVEPQEEPGGVGLVLVLDVSGSMVEQGKIDLALRGSLELIRSSRPQDYIGVVTFSDRATWRFRPRPMTDQGRREAESLLLSATAGGGTNIARAYTQALESLEGLPVRSRQVLVLTDGLAQDVTPNLYTLARDAAPEIRTSTVALGSDADQTFLRDLAVSGGGTFWNVPRAADLPRFFLEEAQRAFQRRSLEGSFPLSVRPHPVTRGLQPPPVSTVLPARAKPWAQSVLAWGEGSVLAVGESGRGRVAALATDLSRSWRDWPGASPLMAELTRWLSQTPARPRAQAVQEQGFTRVVLEGQFERPRLRFGGLEQPFAPTGALRFEARVPAGVLGQVQIFEGEQSRLTLQLPSPPEWRSADGRAALRELAESSGGRLLASPDELRALPSRAALSLQPYLLVLALLLFLWERWLENRRLRRLTA